MLHSMGRFLLGSNFGRLHYKDRRGSGIGRILNPYAEFAQKPQFFPTEHCFLVVLPNRSVAEPAQTSIDLTETQLGSGKTQFTMRNDAPDQDWELIFFRDVFLKKHGEGLRKRTLERIDLLFERYRYTYNFNRRNIAELFSITENGASGFITNCIEHGMIKRNKVDEYCFVLSKE